MKRKKEEEIPTSITKILCMCARITTHVHILMFFFLLKNLTLITKIFKDDGWSLRKKTSGALIN
jgi:hypothetical protein